MNNLLKNLFIISLISIGLKLSAQTLHYNLSFPAPHTHYVEVELVVENSSADKIQVKMPVWTPGSYLVREFARHIDKIEAFDSENKPLTITKIDKNTWLVDTENIQKFRLLYKVYAFELSVRTSFIDQSHAYLNLASILVFLKGLKDQPVTLTFKPYKDWKNISTTLGLVNGDKWQRKAANYDLLIDSPVEIGNHEIINFKAANIPHNLAIYGRNNLDKDKAIKDMKVIIEESTAIFGENPCPNYLFILINTPDLRGGLEHLYSTSLIYKGLNYASDNGYTNWLSLVAHEYFHLWNVKRLRPKALGPFDYNTENYTNLLWFAEGFTSYYDNLILKRGRLISKQAYLDILENDINRLENISGNKVQSVAEASFDAWIKYYRRDENSNNTTVSYYLKGSILALLLDLSIIDRSNGEANLDDLMRELYKTYYKAKKRGFTADEFKRTAQKFVHINMDDFMHDYVFGTKPIDYQSFFKIVGVDIDTETYNILSLGLSYKEKHDRLTVTQVERGSPAYEAGINVHDEIIAVDDWRCDQKFLDNYWQIKSQRADENIKFLLSRQKNILTLEFPFKPEAQTDYSLSFYSSQLSPKQTKACAKWLD